MKTRAQLARSRESLYSTMLPLKEMAMKEVQFGDTVSSSAERGIMCDKILGPDTLNVDMGDFV